MQGCPLVAEKVNHGNHLGQYQFEMQTKYRYHSYGQKQSLRTARGLDDKYILTSLICKIMN